MTLKMTANLLDKKAFYYSLSNDDQQTRVDAIRKVVFFAGEIGFASTYEELLPLLKGLSQEDEDEVLLGMKIFLSNERFFK